MIIKFIKLYNTNLSWLLFISHFTIYYSYINIRIWIGLKIWFVPSLIIHYLYIKYWNVDLSFAIKVDTNYLFIQFNINQFQLQSRTIREFDSRFTAIQFGFDSVNSYYTSASLHDKLHTVKVPYLGLSSQDDPFQPRTGEWCIATSILSWFLTF